MRKIFMNVIFWGALGAYLSSIGLTILAIPFWVVVGLTLAILVNQAFGE